MLYVQKGREKTCLIAVIHIPSLFVVAWIPSDSSSNSSNNVLDFISTSDLVYFTRIFICVKWEEFHSQSVIRTISWSGNAGYYITKKEQDNYACLFCSTYESLSRIAGVIIAISIMEKSIDELDLFYFGQSEVYI